MDESLNMKIIARINTDFPTKFGIPRQSGLADGIKARIVFEPEYRNPYALRGLEGFSHIWLIWEFSAAVRKGWSPTVRPPRLGGNTRMGVFATRSPFRPNAIGLSCVKLDSIDLDTALGPVLNVSGADLMDKTPIFDIKPYLPFTDSHPDALGGFAESCKEYALTVDFPEKWLCLIPEDRRKALIQVLAQDPRPSYQNDPERVYGFEFAGFDVKFKVKDGVLSVCAVIPLTK
jgi:tRNA-Thr(GGU) m(6)t(6)A37 methyltransferase TsaA